MQRLIEEHEEVLSAANENGTKETIEKLDKLCQFLEDKKVMIWKLVRSKTKLGNNLITSNRF